MTAREIRIREASRSIRGGKNTSQKDLSAKLDYLIPQALTIVRAVAPNRRGTLSNSFNYRVVEGGVEIYTDIHYMPYTEEVWISPRWKGRQNPNQDWFKGDAYPLVTRYLALALGGQYVLN